ITGEGSDKHFRAYWHFLPDFLRELDRTWHEQPMVECERQALASAKDRDSERDYKGSEPSLTTFRSDVARRMFSNTSIASNLWAVYGALRPLDESLRRSRAPRRREPGRFDIKALHVVRVLQASDVEGLYTC